MQRPDHIERWVLGRRRREIGWFEPETEQLPGAEAAGRFRKGSDEVTRIQIARDIRFDQDVRKRSSRKSYVDHLGQSRQKLPDPSISRGWVDGLTVVVGSAIVGVDGALVCLVIDHNRRQLR